MFELDDEEIMHVDFERNTVEYTVPKLFITDPTQVFRPLKVYRSALEGTRACKGLLVFYIETEHPTEVRGTRYLHVDVCSVDSHWCNC